MKLPSLQTPHILMLAAATLCLLQACGPDGNKQNEFKVEVLFDESLEQEVLTGRMYLMFSTSEEAEPRFQIIDGPGTQQIFGMDITSMSPGEMHYFTDLAYGYPVKKLSHMPAGDYHVQVLFHRYETFNRADGHTIQLPMDRGEGQQWNKAPGNLYSTPAKVSIDPANGGMIGLIFDKKIEPITPPEDTEWIKHIKIRSKLLSDFWGRDMYLGAHVLLPQGFDEHPEAKYPLVINHGHFPHDFDGFRTTPPDPDMKPEYSDRFGVDGYNIIVQEQAHQFYKDWTSEDFPRVLLVEIQHANPFYDDSYAVNSENLGPYGDAITYELIPYIEEQFRGMGEGWARFLYGGSTGGWEALAAQVLYPEEYNGCWAACPDPIDFRAYTVVNLYEDENAYYQDGPFKKVPRPGHRDYLGHVSATLEQMNQRELALGTHSRSGQQWDIWEAVYSPVGDDGYPQRIWDKETGEINHEVAAHWKENYDLTHIMNRDWETLGPKLQGKVHIYCGDMDNYYLNNAVYLAEEMLENAQPAYEGEVDYGNRAEHCWNGDHDRPNHLSRLRYHQMFIPRAVERIFTSAPEGADLESWRY